MTYDAASSYTCIRCQTPVHPDDVVFCSVCGKPHHLACWNAAGACSAPECPGTQAVKPAPEDASAPPVVQSPEPPMQTMQPPLPPIYAMPPPPQSAGGLATTGTPIPGFINEVGLGACLSNGWSAFREYTGTCILTAFVGLLLFAASALIPCLNLFAMLLVLPALSGGAVIFGLNTLYRRDPGVGDLFAGFQRYGQWLGSVLLYGLISFAIMLPMMGWQIYSMVKGGYFSPGAVPPTPWNSLTIGGPVYWILYAATMIVYYYLFVRWFFYFPLIAEGESIIDAFGKSVQLTAGIRWRLFGILIVLGLISTAGFITLLGWLITLPLVGLAYLSLYVAARNQQMGPSL